VLFSDGQPVTSRHKPPCVEAGPHILYSCCLCLTLLAFEVQKLDDVIYGEQ